MPTPMLSTVHLLHHICHTHLHTLPSQLIPHRNLQFFPLPIPTYPLTVSVNKFHQDPPFTHPHNTHIHHILRRNPGNHNKQRKIPTSEHLTWSYLCSMEKMQ
jgi:hypothetical protein